MELKHNNSNGEIVLASELNPYNFILLNFLKIALKNKSCKLFFSQMLSLPSKQDGS